MNKTGLYFLFLMCLLLTSCATPTIKIWENKKKNIEYNAVLTDPVVKKDFRTLKSIAVNAPMNQNSFNEVTIKHLDDASAVLIDRLQNHYHLNNSKYNIHTFIGRNKGDSCRQYYDSFHSTIGTTCQDSRSQFGSCNLCERYVSIVKSRSMRVVHAPSRHNTDTMALIDTFRLRNGDFVYLGLELSPEG